MRTPSAKDLAPIATATDVDFEIVGVVEDAKYQDTRGPAYATYFLPYLQRVQCSDPGDQSGEANSHNV